MNRVLVIGCSGAGKSVFSRRLSDRTGLPLIHLDQRILAAWLDADAPDAWRQRVAALVAEPRWIMDGQFGGTLGLRLRHADTVFVVRHAALALPDTRPPPNGAPLRSHTQRHGPRLRRAT